MKYDHPDLNVTVEEIVSTLISCEAPKQLGIMALCKAIVEIGDDADLDEACRMIDEMREEKDG